MRVRRFRHLDHTGVITSGINVVVTSTKGGAVPGSLITEYESPAHVVQVQNPDDFEDIEPQCGGVVNAGFFNTTSLEPIGDTVFYRGGLKTVKSDAGGPRNVGLGRKGGEILMGWVPGVDEGFDWYFSGLLWLVRGGKKYTDTR